VNTYEIEFADVLLDATRQVAADSFSCEGAWVCFYMKNNLVCAVPAAHVRIVRQSNSEQENVREGAYQEYTIGGYRPAQLIVP